MPSDAPFTIVNAAIVELITSHSGVFVSMGQRLFRSFAIIAIVWFGVKLALSSGNDHQGPYFHHFASLLLTIAFGFAMVTYYDTPIPGFGRSFKAIVLDQGLFLSARLEAGTNQELQEWLFQSLIRLEAPTLFAGPLQYFRYWVMLLMIIAMQLAVFAVIAFGYVALAVVVLVGPVFLPFFIVPTMEWMFWGWLKAFLQYSFYQVVANAFVFVWAQLLMRSYDDVPSLPSDSATMASVLFQYAFLTLASVYGVFKIPSVVNSIFAGRSGESALPRGPGG